MSRGLVIWLGLGAILGTIILWAQAPALVLEDGGIEFPDGTVQSSAAFSELDLLQSAFRTVTVVPFEGGNVDAFTVPADKSRYITGVWVCCSSPRLLDLRIQSQSVLFFAGESFWSSGGGASLVAAPSQTVSVNAAPDGDPVVVTISGFEI